MVLIIVKSGVRPRECEVMWVFPGPVADFPEAGKSITEKAEAEQLSSWQEPPTVTAVAAVSCSGPVSPSDHSRLQGRIRTLPGFHQDTHRLSGFPAGKQQLLRATVTVTAEAEAAATTKTTNLFVQWWLRSWSWSCPAVV